MICTELTAEYSSVVSLWLTDAEAEAFAANHGCLCVETSAKDAVNVGQLFTMIS